MNEKALPVLEQYDVNISGQKRVRGTYCCESNKGTLLLKEYLNSQGRIHIVDAIQKHLVENDMVTDIVLRNKEDKLTSVGPEGGLYVLKRWFDYRECQWDDPDDIMSCIDEMAKFHKICNNMRETLTKENIFLADEITEDKDKDFKSIYSDGVEQTDSEEEITLRYKMAPPENIKLTLEKHNKELIRVQRFLSKRKKKTKFEYELERCINRNLPKSIDMVEGISFESAERVRDKVRDNMTVCHGECKYHNFIFCKDQPVLINFVKVKIGNPIEDVYAFMRKIIEKNEFDHKLSLAMLERYQKGNKLDDDELKLLCVMMEYPDRLWKVANNYYNSNKSGYSLKNEEKLEKFISMEEKRVFLSTKTL